MKQICCILLTFLVLFSSCKDNYTFCNESKTVQFSSSFYKKIGTTEVSTTAPDLKVVDIASGALLIANQQNLSSFSLSLNPLKDSMKFQISLASSLPVDTLTVIYSTQNKALSPDCGVISVHNVIKAYTTKHTLDTIKITNTTVNNDNLQNSRIIYQ
jgi:Family of unknown function (DUF6452)